MSLSSHVGIKLLKSLMSDLSRVSIIIFFQYLERYFFPFMCKETTGKY
jgi:hypothetical protein